MLGFLFIFIGVVCIVASFFIPQVKRDTTHVLNKDMNKILNYYFNNGFITEEEFINFQFMNSQQQINWMNEQLRQMNDMQHQQFINEMQLQQVQIDQFIQQVDMNQSIQQFEMDRLMSTGIEFGGLNSDLNLNPGQQSLQNDMMNHMNNNNMGGPGMF